MKTPIIILILLIAPLIWSFSISKFTGRALDIRKYAMYGLGISFIFFSIGHAVKANDMVQMLPAWVPMRLSIIALTGLLEVVIGVALFIPRLQLNAAKLAILVLIAFFPANIYAALNSTGLGGHQWGPIYLVIRTPLQLTLISWAYFLCIKGPDIKLKKQEN